MSRGIHRERQVRRVKEAEDYVVVRAAGSLGPVDLVAMRAGSRPQLIEVKSTINPYDHFPPADRAEMLLAAEMAGGDAVLAWWPKGGTLRWIPSCEWPAPRRVKV